MKKLLLFTCSLFAAYGFSQTTLFQDNFESGSSQWTLNTGSGANNWTVNNAYLGFSGFIPDTPNQPVSFTNGPQSTYMHITNTTACGGLAVCNANFDTGSASNQNTEIATSIDASGNTNVTVSFWYLCAGQTNVSFGTMEYSLDGGLTWIGTGTNYQNVSSWTQESVSLPAWDNAAAFKIRFKWQNGGGGLDPAFSIDELIITGMAGATNSIITTDFQTQLSWCFGDSTSLQVQFDASGSYNPGNIFTAELSDASGSFAAPISIGNFTSSASGIQTVFGYAYGAIPAGTGYRIRVIASNPATIGTDNGTDIIIYPLPSVSSSTYADLCVNGMPISLTGGMPSGGNYTGVGVSGGSFDPSAAGVGTASVDYSIIDVNGCMNTVTETIVVHAAPVVTFATIPDHCVSYSPYTLMAQPAGGTFTGPGVSGDIFTPATAGVGTWTITYDYTDGNGCSGQALQIVNVDGCVGLFENNKIEYSIYPNPAQGNFTIVSEIEFDAIELRDINGRLIQSINSNELVNISKLSSGVYFIEMNHEGQLYTERLMIK